MYKDIKKAIEFVESKNQRHSFKFYQELISNLGLNKLNTKIIHVTGTNGKGSTIEIISKLLQLKGYKVGTYTSPYIICHNDRIRINGENILDDKFLYYLNCFLPIINKHNLSRFEIDTLIMLQYFKDSDLDYALIECGIGGREDKTNVIDGDYGIITNVGLDHQNQLGNTLKDIAFHKVGIIKDKMVVYTNETNKDILSLFEFSCLNNRAKLIRVKGEVEKNYFKDYKFPPYLQDNLNLGIKVVKDLENISDDLINSCLGELVIPCRFEQIGKFILDGAHNIDGIKALKKALRYKRDIGIVFSALGDKDVDSMLKELKKYDLIQASFEDPRQVSNDIAYQDAIELMANKHKLVVITGSLHFVSLVRKYLRG